MSRRPQAGDARTTAYFDEHCPEYSPRRLDHACTWIRDNTSQNASLLDVGCGSGNVLEHVAARTGLGDLTGMDTSRALLDKAQDRLDCRTHLASITDPALVERIGRQFDVVLLAAVLHHLVAGTRRSSYRRVAAGLGTAVSVTAPGGHLVVVEPVFAPRPPLSALFYVKRAVSAVTSSRVELFDTWNNIGAPVVSYLTPHQLVAMVGEIGDVVEVHREPGRLHPVMRLGGIRERWEMTVIARRRQLNGRSDTQPHAR